MNSGLITKSALTILFLALISGPVALRSYAQASGDAVTSSAAAPATEGLTPPPADPSTGSQPAGQAPQTDAAQPADPRDATTVLSHPETTRWWLSGQMNFIGQAHGSFPAKYSGPNSLKNTREADLSNLLTLYSGYELTTTTEVIFDVESAGGHGISDALGLGGFTDLDVVRSPDLGQTPYLARLMIHKIIPLTAGTVEAERGPYALYGRLPARRLEIRFGKFSLVDFFDLNSVGSDSHLQFLNWTDDNNGAYDYAANTRGYTWGAMVEYDDRRWAVRYAAALMPKVANGPNLDANFTRAHGDNWEVEAHHRFVRAGDTIVRLLSYVNHADMGSYREAIQQYEEGKTRIPNVVATREQGRIKYGFGLNLEQPVTSSLTGYARLGWGDGKTESFAYTEVDRTLNLGASLRGELWHRRFDKIGGAFVVNGISGDHREYLRLGGLGFLLGDGNLNYGTERIFETYYTARLRRGVFGSIDLQHITDPGYNRDRGPVLVPSLRVHIDF